MDIDAVATRLNHGPWARSTLEVEEEMLYLGVELISTGELIDDVMLRWLSATDRCGEIGYVLHPDHGGNRRATEAAHAIFRLAFDVLDLHRMIARIDARNTASIRLAQRAGMRREAHLIQNHCNTNGWGDEVDFALLKTEWNRAPTCVLVKSSGWVAPPVRGARKLTAPFDTAGQPGKRR